MKIRSLLIAGFLIVGACAVAKASLSTKLPQTAKAKPSGIDTSRCSDYCANTPTGEEPWVIELREAEAERKELFKNGKNKEIWERYSIYSDSTEPEHLKLPLDRESGLEIRLDPKKGTLNIEKAGFKQVFGFTSPQGTPRDICPNYSVRVIDASSTHAVIERLCSLYEYQPQRFNDGVEYLLYDMATATMQTIWMAAGEGTRPFPQPSPHPNFKKIENGYKLDWVAVDPSDKTKFSMHTEYIRKMDEKENEMYLVCTDLAVPKEDADDDPGACYGGGPLLVKE